MRSVAMSLVHQMWLGAARASKTANGSEAKVANRDVDHKMDLSHPLGQIPHIKHAPEY